MAKWTKGQSGNTAGRPPKERAIAEALTKAFRKSRTDSSGKKRNGTAIIAESVVSALITGKLILDDKETRLEPKEWIDLFKFASNHVDGPVKSQMELTGIDDGPIEVKAIDYRIAVTALAPRPMDDSTAPGED